MHFHHTEAEATRVRTSVATEQSTRVHAKGGAACDRVLSATDLRPHIAALDAQLVDLTLSDVGSLLGLVQLVLQLAELPEVGVCVLLLSMPWTDKES